MNKVSLPCKLENHMKSLPVLTGHSFERHSKCRTSIKVINISAVDMVHIGQAGYHQPYNFIIFRHDRAIPMHRMQTKSPVTTLIIPFDDSFTSPHMTSLWKTAKRMT